MAQAEHNLHETITEQRLAGRLRIDLEIGNSGKLCLQIGVSAPCFSHQSKRVLESRASALVA